MLFLQKVIKIIGLFSCIYFVLSCNSGEHLVENEFDNIRQEIYHSNEKVFAMRAKKDEYFFQIMKLTNESKLDSALKLIDKASKEIPSNFSDWNMQLGRIEFIKKNYSKADSILTYAIDNTNHNLPNVRRWRGYVRAYLGECEKAKIDFDIHLQYSKDFGSDTIIGKYICDSIQNIDRN